jgi:hypothetical protein
MIDPNVEYPIWSPYDSFEAAKILLDELKASELKSAEDSFRQGWKEARNGETRPISELWDQFEQNE